MKNKLEDYLIKFVIFVTGIFIGTTITCILFYDYIVQYQELLRDFIMAVDSYNYELEYLYIHIRDKRCIE